MASATTKITSKESKQVSGKAKWTFMVFMAGDNNLDGAALRDITEMAQAGSAPFHILSNSFFNRRTVLLTSLKSIVLS